MNEIWKEIFKNLTLIGYVFLIFILLYIANIALSIRINVFKLKEEWNNEKFINGVANMLILGASCVLTSVAFTMIPFSVNKFMITTSDDILKFCNNLIIASVFFDSIFEYSKEVIEKLRFKIKIDKASKEENI